MKIGTPLSKTATKVMLLGCGELGKEVIIALQRLGIEVIGVDRYKNAPGHQVAHRAYVIDMIDATALKALIEKEKPDLVVPEIEAIATDMLAEIEAEKITTIIPTARATQLTMNREGIRCLAAETLNIVTSKYAFAESLDELKAAIDNDIGFPCIVKPVMSSSGKGQSTINNADDIQIAWDYAISGARVATTRIIVEEKINFDYEITLLTVRALNEKGEINTYFCEPIGHIQQQGDYVESWQPQEMSTSTLEKAQHIAKTVTDNLGGRGLFGVELFIKGDKVYFSEVSPRPHDTGMVTMITQNQNEFELHARAILGLPISTALHTPGASAVIYGGVEKKGIEFEHIEKALAIPQTDIRLFGKPEAFVKRRMGVALAYDNNTDTARDRAKKAAGMVKTK
ncbi:Phosphoribosylglycinamide formyltransferase 2 [hydrothermal vent metagenome]|uniref:Phosphoribosylglycinamide formyltransferase 2 n=1 Tax=hydrothermal vent metagenome TaxID=652676 RepID=A0A3B0ZCV4_9ZZZZ